jgi:hypothetical protein
MGNNNNINIEDDLLRGHYAREIGNHFKNYGINPENWHVSPSPKKAEILIHPRKGTPENERSISRISLQIRDDEISFGVSGYYPHQIDETKKVLEERGYKYHDRGYTDDGRPKGRWWLVTKLDSLESIAKEFKSIEPIIEKSNSCKC